MSRTNAGYTITDSMFIGTVEFVIGHHSSAPAPYVTWMCRAGTDYFWGHYCASRRDAEKDLLRRMQDELQLQELESSQK